MREHVDAQLETWASLGVYGHFTELARSPLTAWQDMAEQCARQSVDLVGASADEIVIMNSLTSNIHFLMASFYRPTAKRHKIILEWKPFPSDWVCGCICLLCLSPCLTPSLSLSPSPLYLSYLFFTTPDHDL